MTLARPRNAWLAAGALLAAAALRPACSGETEGGGDSAGASGASGAGASGGSGAVGGAGATGGSGGSSASGGSPQYDGGTWQPTGDPGWTKIAWVDCGAMYAKRPEHAVPPLVWKACEGGVAGCQRLVVNWDYKFPPLATMGNYGGGVFQTASGLILVVGILLKSGVDIMAAYADAATPIAAWQGPGGCGPWLVEWSSKHICQTFGGLPPLRVGLIPLGGDPNAAPLKSFLSTADVPVACNATKLFVMDTANDYYVRDLQTDVVHEIGWPSGTAFDPRVHGDMALVQRWGSDSTGKMSLEGWLWTPPNTLVKLVDAAPDLVYDIRTDGTTLAWLQAPATDIDQWVPADIWVSPFAAEPGALSPKKLRAHPSAAIGASDKRLGGGYYAVLEARMLPEGRFPSPSSPDHRLHLYRISDGRHWEVPRFPDPAPGNSKPDESLAIPGSVLALDANEIWWEGRSQYTGQTWTVVRQRLDALGPGD